MNAGKKPSRPNGKPASPKTTKPKAGVAQQAERRPSKSEVSGSSPDARSKPAARVEWAAVEADHNTGRYTDGQLAAKHGVSREAIVRKRKRDQAADPRRWQKDLTDQVRQATNALLLREQITAERSQVTATITEGHSATAILTAAEVAKSVILRHRTDIAETTALAKTLLGEIVLHTRQPDEIERALEAVKEDATPKEVEDARAALRQVMSVHNRVSSVQKLADTLTKLQNLDRRAFNMDAGEDPESPRKPSGGASKFSMSDDEIAAEIAQIRAERRQSAAA